MNLKTIKYIENGIKMIRTVMEFFIMSMEINMKANGKMEINLEEANTFTIIRIDTKEIGRMIKDMGRES